MGGTRESSKKRPSRRSGLPQQLEGPPRALPRIPRHTLTIGMRDSLISQKDMIAIAPIATAALRAPAPLMMTAQSAAPVLTPVTAEWVGALPGVTSPFGFFDPLKLAPESQEEFMLFRETELVHPSKLCTLS